MKRFNSSRIGRVSVVVATVALAMLLYVAWSVMAKGALPSPKAAPPPSIPIEVTEVAPPASPPELAGQAAVPAPVMAQVAAAGTEPASASSARSCTLNGCPPLTPAACNTVVRFDTRGQSLIWNDYNCVDHSVFPAGSLVFREEGYTVQLPQKRDLSLAVPLVMSVTQGSVITHMNVFAAILTDCDNNACIAGSENKDLVIYRHAIYTDAPTAVYTTVVDSDNLDGFGDMIIACGNPNPGWCDDAPRPAIICDNYTISDTTEGGPDDITFYDSRYWLDEYAYDGPERIYQIVLTQTSVFSFTLHYSGSETLDYYNYMSYFILDDTCDQRNVWDNPAPPEHLFIGEGTYTQTHSIHYMQPGTYYLVVDGMHLPTQGDAFKLDIQCVEPVEVFLPLVLRDYPAIPRVTVNPTSGPLGTLFWFTGANFEPGENIPVWFTSPGGTQYDLGAETADSQGGFIAGLRITAGPTGTYTFYARGDQSQHTASVNFQITASAQGNGTGEESLFVFSVR